MSTLVHNSLKTEYPSMSFRIWVIIISFAAIVPFSQDPVSARSDDNGLCNCVVFRMDDIQDYWIAPGQLSPMDLFISKNQSLSLGLVMNEIGNDTRIIEKIKAGTQRGLFELALHGWDHVPYTQLNKEEQKLSLHKANEKMRLLFGNKSDIFIPPQNLYNNATLDSMNQLELKVLSSSQTAEENANQQKNVFVAPGAHIFEDSNANELPIHLPQTVEFKEFDGDTRKWVKNPVQNILTKVVSNIQEYGYGVIVIHPQDFMKANMNGSLSDDIVDENELRDLSLLVDSLVARNIQVTSFSEIAGIEPKTYPDATVSDTATPDFNFAAVGDWGCFPDSVRTVNVIIDKDPELILALGDFSYMSTASCWLDLVEPIKLKIKLAIGNHEVESTSLLNQYMSAFNLTSQYYSFDYQNIHFTIMSTELPYEEGSDQYNFVRNDLAKTSADPSVKWIIVGFHRPMYSFLESEQEEQTSETDDIKYNQITGDYHTISLQQDSHTEEQGGTNEVQDVEQNHMAGIYHPLFDEYGVDLVLYAHVHAYDRSYPVKYVGDVTTGYPAITEKSLNNYTLPEGQIYSTVGTGGAYLHGPFTKTRFLASQYDGHGFLNIEVTNNGNTLNAKFYSNDGTTKDEFSITNALHMGLSDPS